MDNKKFSFIITNFITLLRVIGIFAIIPVYKIYGGYITFLLATFCFLTDCIDGFLARKLKCSTFFGSLFDALSDKAFLVVNMLLLMSISPLAIILVLFELGIAYIQSVKYNKGMNIKTNIFGKIKMWIAGIVISISYLFAKDANNILFSLLFLPLILCEVLTIGSYIKEFFDELKKITPQVLEQRDKENKKLKKIIKNTTFKEIMFENKYYEKYKDYGNLKLVRTLSKKNKR